MSRAADVHLIKQQKEGGEKETQFLFSLSFTRSGLCCVLENVRSAYLMLPGKSCSMGIFFSLCQSAVSVIFGSYCYLLSRIFNAINCGERHGQEKFHIVKMFLALQAPHGRGIMRCWETELSNKKPFLLPLLVSCNVGANSDQKHAFFGYIATV